MLAGAYGSLWAGKRRKRVPPERGAKTMTSLLPGWNAQNISSRTPTPLVKCGKTLRLHTFSFNSPGLSILERPLFGHSPQSDIYMQNIPHFRNAERLLSIHTSVQGVSRDRENVIPVLCHCIMPNFRKDRFPSLFQRVHIENRRKKRLP